MGWPRRWAQLGHWGTAAGQTHGHVEAATAPTCHHVPSWHPLSPLGSARGAPLGTTMLDWAQVGTSCPAAQLTHPGSTPLSGKHLATPKTSPLHLSEPKKTWYWLRYPNCHYLGVMGWPRPLLGPAWALGHCCWADPWACGGGHGPHVPPRAIMASPKPLGLSQGCPAGHHHA